MEDNEEHTSSLKIEDKEVLTTMLMLDTIGENFHKTNDRTLIDEAIDEMMDVLGNVMYTREKVNVVELLEGIVES